MRRFWNSMANDATNGSMSLWEHLEDLRGMLIRSLGVLGLFWGIGIAAATPLNEMLQRPLAGIEPPIELVFSAPLDAFRSRIGLGLLGGVVLSAPFLVYFLWAFVSPGLTRRERRVMRATVWIGAGAFFLGMGFAYRLLYFSLPAIVRMGLGGTRHLWSLHSYLSFCIRFLLAFGVVFEMPVLLVALGRLGLVRAEVLRRGRPYVTVALFVLAAVLTPPDPLTQILLALPLLLLYEASIIVVHATQRNDA